MDPSLFWGHPEKRDSWRAIFTLAYQSLGVVYGDLSTSPLYVYKSAFAENIQNSETNEEVYGVLCFVFWTLTLIPLLKYVFIVLRADDNGEGGTFALYSLLCRHARLSSLPNHQLADEELSAYTTDRPETQTAANFSFSSCLKSTLEKCKVLQRVLLVLALIGTCMVIGDGVLSPAISVFSAVSGLELSMAKEHHQYIEVPLACGILVFLFALQHYGTHQVGFLFAPVVIVWLLCISAIGLYNIFYWNPLVYKALSPYYMFKFLKKTRKQGWMALGGILLCVTGSEAMFADLGHFSQFSIQLAFTLVVYPSLVLAYMGQAAYLSQHHDLDNDHRIGFYVSVPEKVRWPVLAIAILAAVVGSQAIITGTFSIIKQCSALGCFPRVKIIHTSSKIHGQIYIPLINWILMILCLAVTIGFRDTKRLGNAAEIVRGVLSNVVSSLVKRLWSMKSSAKTAVSSRSMMKFESGYTVETVFDGSKLGIDPYSVEVSPSGELLILDAENSNIYKISMPLSRFSRPKLVSGSAEGYSGHVDGHPREARMNHPKGFTLDARGNVYIADTMNMAIRKISDTGVTTIAGGRWNQGNGHIDGPSEDAKFSNDFDVVYVGSSCSLLVIDRGNSAIREIELNYDDCNTQYADSLNLGVVLLVAAGLFGYLLALLQRRVQAMFSSPQKDQDIRSHQMMKATPVAPYQRPPLKSVRPSLIPNEDEPEKLEEGFFGSLGRLFVNSGSSVADIFGGLLSGFRRKPLNNQIHQQFQPVNRHPNAWPLQESFMIPDEDEPPSIEAKTPTIKKTYPFMTQDLDRSHQFKPNRSYFNGWDSEFHQQQKQQQIQHNHQQQHIQHHHQQQQHIQQHHHQQQQHNYNRQYSAGPTTYYEKSCETSEIVFGAVQEQDGRREAMVIKAVDYGDPRYNHHNIRARYNYTGNPNSY